ncbi:MAG: hypothetical protein JWR12_2985 [Mucilaginibacter sp.]|nr:hypothetical protein [Mucilaginibacter sp.]
MTSDVLLKEDNMRSPQEALASFLGNYSPDQVRILLWEAFKGYALHAPEGLSVVNDDEMKIALLFDELVELVTAVHALRNAGKLDGLL